MLPSFATGYHLIAHRVGYSLALVLSLLILGKLAGMTTLSAIAEWGPLARGLAAPGVPWRAGAVSLPGDL